MKNVFDALKAFVVSKGWEERGSCGVEENTPVLSLCYVGYAALKY